MIDIIVYSDHLKLRLKIRNISYKLPEKIYQTADERYFDSETKNLVAIKTINYKRKMREMALVYKENFNEIILITVHPLKLYQKISRVNSERWIRI